MPHSPSFKQVISFNSGVPTEPENTIPSHRDIETPCNLQAEPSWLPCPSVSPSYNQINPYTTYMGSSDFANLEKKLYESRMDIQKKQAYSQIDYDNYRRKHELHAESNAIQDLMAPRIYISHTGEMRFEKYLTKDNAQTFPLCNMREISTTVYTPHGSSKYDSMIYHISYTTNGNPHSVTFSQQELGNNKVTKKLTAYGVDFFVPKKFLNDNSSSIEQFLCENANKICIFDAYGWNQYNDEWVFIYPQDLIWEELKNGRKDY